MLDRIPTEVLGLIVAKIRTHSDLKSLCEVSKYFAKVATPHLYETIALHSDDNLDLDGLKHKIELCCNDNIKFTKKNCLRAPLHHNLGKRCPHCDPELPETLADTLDMADGSEVDFAELDPFWDFSSALDDLLSSLQEGSLKSSSFNLGCRVPSEILGLGNPFWTDEPKHLQSMSLVTDGGCSNTAFSDYLSFKPFPSMQSLSWKGLNRGDHFDCLARFFKEQAGAQELRSLELDLVNWTRADSGWYSHQRATLGGFPPRPDNFFATSILGVQPDQEIVLFQSLEALQLTGVAFSPFEKELSHSFNTMNLTTLQLRNCPASFELLGAILEQGITMKVKSFELAIDWECLHHYQDFVGGQEDVVYRFLDYFQGLEDLFLLLTQPIEWYLVANSIVNHQTTLKRLVVHERKSPEGGAISVDGGIPWDNSGELLFHESKLRCFGTGGPISEMESSFKKLPTKPRCKILHIKVSWIDYHKEWEEEVLNVDPEDSEFEEFGSPAPWSGQKPPMYPRDETVNEDFNITQIHPSKGSSSSNLSELQELVIQEPKVSKRTSKIANRSDFSGPAQDFLKFASWAFGPEGIPELRILAWGDFSHDGRWGESNALLCRDQSLQPTGINFRTLRDSDFYYWDLIDDNMDMLAACSPDDILWEKDGVF